MHQSAPLALALSAALLLSASRCEDPDTLPFPDARLSTPEDAMIVAREVLEMIGTSATGEGRATRGFMGEVRALQDQARTSLGESPPQPCPEGGTADGFQEERDVRSPFAPKGTKFTVRGTDYARCGIPNRETGERRVLTGREEYGVPALPFSPEEVSYWSVSGGMTPLFLLERMGSNQANAVPRELRLRGRSDGRVSAANDAALELIWVQSVYSVPDQELQVAFNLGSPRRPFRFETEPDGGERIEGELRYRAEGPVRADGPGATCPLGLLHIRTEEPFVHGLQPRPGRLHLRADVQQATVDFHQDGGATVTVFGQEPRRFSKTEIAALPRCDGPLPPD